MNKTEAAHVILLQNELKDFVKEMDKKYKDIEVKCKAFPNQQCFVCNVNINSGYFRILLKTVDIKYGTYSYESVHYDDIIWSTME